MSRSRTYLAAYWCALYLSAAELSELLAGDDPPGGGYLAKAARLTAARHQAEEIISHEYRPTAEDEDDGDEDDELAPAGERPVVVDRSHPSWAYVDAEQRERLVIRPVRTASHDRKRYLKLSRQQELIFNPSRYSPADTHRDELRRSLP